MNASDTPREDRGGNRDRQPGRGRGTGRPAGGGRSGGPKGGGRGRPGDGFKRDSGEGFKRGTKPGTGDARGRSAARGPRPDADGEQGKWSGDQRQRRDSSAGRGSGADRRPQSADGRKRSWEARSESKTGRRGSSDREQSSGERRPWRADRQPPGAERRRPARDGRTDRRETEFEREPRQFPPGLEPAANEPELPVGYDDAGLPAPLRAELRGVSKQVASKVGGHLRAAGELVDIDPGLALRHALVARRLASRLPVVREVTAEVAYVAGDYETALTEYRALHRMSGDDDYLPVIADCERAVGKHQSALRTLAQARDAKLSLAQQVEVILVEAGTRNDMGQRAEAVRLLKQAISGKGGGRQGQARFRYAYANLLAEAGAVDAARDWLVSARGHDENDELLIDDRLAELAGKPPVVREFNDEFEIMEVENAEEPTDDDAGDQEDQ